jgi:uncharacterized membrane protein YdjX (TVP38/TMEM64 family)
MKIVYRLLPILLITGLMLGAYLTGFYQVIEFETLRYLHVEMIEFVNNHPFMTPLMFMGYSAGSTILSIPGGFMLGLLAGFLFPQPWCALYYLCGATLGASLVFLSAKIAIGRGFQGNHFQRYIVSYMLFIRLVPFLPFPIANLIPAFFNVRLRTFIWTTMVGMLPKVLILTVTGKGFNTVFESAGSFSVRNIFNAEVQIILLCLGLFSLLPILIRKKVEN